MAFPETQVNPTIYQIIRRVFNVVTNTIKTGNPFATGTSTRPTVTSASSAILASNTSRKYAYVFNQSGAVIYIKLGATAVVGEGIRLPNNEMFEITSDKLWTGAINAIRGAGSGAVEVFEGT